MVEASGETVVVATSDKLGTVATHGWLVSTRCSIWWSNTMSVARCVQASALTVWWCIGPIRPLHEMGVHRPRLARSS
jgi:hypothetical protein